ncbi:MAG: pilin [Patescibacteria group bacterium]
MKFNKKWLFVIIFLLLITALPASAALPTLVPKCASQVTAGAPPLSCILELGVNITNWILGITGSLAILYFVYGGFLFLISQGNEQQISKGKTILTQAVIGIIIIFGAYVGVKFIVSALGASKYFKTEFEIQKPIDGSIPATTPDTTSKKCSDCTCYTGTTYSKIGGSYSSSEECMSQCKKQGQSGGYCPSLNPPDPKGCSCYCGDKSNTKIIVPQGTTPNKASCESKCSSNNQKFLDCRAN